MKNLRLKNIVHSITSIIQHTLSLVSYRLIAAHQSLSLRYLTILKLFFKAVKNAWTRDSKWCNYVVCPAEGGPLFNR